MKPLLKITSVIIVLVLSFFTGLLGAYVFIQIANLFGLDFIAQFSFVQIYGILILISILGYKYEKSGPEESFSETMVGLFFTVFARAAIILLTWGLSFIAYYILT